MTVFRFQDFKKRSEHGVKLKRREL